MKLDVKKEQPTTAFKNIPEGVFFWYNGVLYLKPKIGVCIHDSITRTNPLLVLDIETDMLTSFSDDSTEVIPELTPLKLSYEEDD